MMHPAIGRLMSYGPGFLVPAAWLVVLMRMNGMIGDHPLFMAHLVMLGFLVVFLLVGWSRMEEGLFRVWRTIIAVGVVATAAGTAGLSGVSPATFLLGASLVYWMVKPGIGLVHTGRSMDDPVFLWTGAVSLLGAFIVLAAIGGVIDAVDVGLVLVGAGQSAGMGYTIAVTSEP